MKFSINKEVLAAEIKTRTGSRIPIKSQLKYLYSSHPLLRRTVRHSWGSVKPESKKVWPPSLQAATQGWGWGLGLPGPLAGGAAFQDRQELKCLVSQAGDGDTGVRASRVGHLVASQVEGDAHGA